jgi:hypothetical protein
MTRDEEEIMGLEQHLTALASAMTYPATPDLASGFWRRLQSSREVARPASGLSFAGLAVAGAVVVASVLVGTVTPARDAAADLFDRVNIFETDEPLSGLPTDVRGDEVSLAEAELALGQRIAPPADSELTLDKVVLQEFGPVRAAVLYYEQPNGEQFALFAVAGLVAKGLPTGSEASDAEPVSWPGVDAAAWLTGPRRVEYRDPEGAVIEESVRQTGENTLIWQRGDLVYRIEGALDQAEAIATAESMRVPE